MRQDRSDVPEKSRRTKGKMAKAFAIRAVVYSGIYLSICAYIAYVTVQPKHRPIPNSAVAFGSKATNITFQSADGTKLCGWLVSPGEHPKGVVVLCHGIDGDRTAMIKPAQMLVKHGYAALLFDFRARGESGGNRCTIGYRETDDLLAAIAMVRARKELHGLPVGLLGHSMGGAVVLMAASRAADIHAVIAESPFASLDHAIHNHFLSIFGAGAKLIESPVIWFGQRLIGKPVDDIAPAKVINRIAPGSVLLIQDANDKLCPPSETKQLMSAAGDPKALWTVPNAGHVEAVDRAPDAFEAHIDAFFDHNLAKPIDAHAKPPTTR